MRHTTPALKRIIGGGFAVAVAAAFVIPGVAAADETTPTPDTGSLSSLSSDTGGSGEVPETTTTPAAGDEDGDSIFGSVSDVLACFSSDDSDDPDADDDSDALGSVSTVIDCITDALGTGTDTDTDTGTDG